MSWCYLLCHVALAQLDSHTREAATSDRCELPPRCLSVQHLPVGGSAEGKAGLPLTHGDPGLFLQVEVPHISVALL